MLVGSIVYILIAWLNWVLRLEYVYLLKARHKPFTYIQNVGQYVYTFTLLSVYYHLSCVFMVSHPDMSASCDPSKCLWTQIDFN